MAARCGRETFPRMSLWTEYNYIYPGSPRPFKERGFGGDLSLAWTPVCTWSFDHWRWKCSRTCTPLGAQKVRCSQHGKYQSSFGGSRGRILWTNFFWCFLTAMSTQNLFETSRHGGPKAPWKKCFCLMIQNQFRDGKALFNLSRCGFS
jgi:hypothetical protein